MRAEIGAIEPPASHLGGAGVLSIKQTTTMSDELIDRAYHEAGHAVVGIRLGCRLRTVQIVPRPAALFHRRPVTPNAWLMRTLAGGVAERYFLSNDYVGDGADMENLKAALGQRRFDRGIERLRLDAVGLVIEHRRAIEDVAKVLRHAGALSHDEVTQIADHRIYFGPMPLQ